jgi:cell division protein FtsW (lipid II flippase)
MASTEKYVWEFLQTTCEQIRFKSVHKSIISELSAHIEDQKCEYMKNGLDEETATIKAVEQMGDPVLVGKRLDMAHRPRTEWSILSLALILVVMGGAIQYFISSLVPYNSGTFLRFLVYLPIGFGAFLFTYFFDYTLLGRYSKSVYVMFITVSFAGLYFFDSIYGTYIHLYYLIQLFIPVFSGIVFSFRNRGYPGIIASSLLYSVVAVFCFNTCSISNLLVVTAACLIILSVAIFKGYFNRNKIISLALAYVPVIITIVMFIPNFLQRGYNILSQFIPGLDPDGSIYVSLLIRRMLASSKMFGKAQLNGNISDKSIEEILPAWSTDFSLTYIIARLGFVAGFMVVFILLILVLRMFASTFKQKNAYGFILSFSACLSITIQAVVYIISNLGVILFPSTLPFVSFGGTSFVVNMILIGLVLSVYRRTDIVSNTSKIEACSKK